MMGVSKELRASILIVGGTAAYHLDLRDYGQVVSTRRLDTPYGVSALFSGLRVGPGQPILFLSRHGDRKLELIPASINSRANLFAARQLGVERVFSWNGVGAVNRLLRTGDLLVPDGLIDLTQVRARYFDPQGRPESQPGGFDPAGREALLRTARKRTPRVFEGVYACFEGPKLETAAEIRLAAAWGCDVVGMTLVPEVQLACELGMKYASLAIVTNLATGIEVPGRAGPSFGVEVGQLGMEICLEACGTDPLEERNDARD